MPFSSLGLFSSWACKKPEQAMKAVRIWVRNNVFFIMVKLKDEIVRAPASGRVKVSVLDAKVKRIYDLQALPSHSAQRGATLGVNRRD